MRCDRCLILRDSDAHPQPVGQGVSAGRDNYLSCGKPARYLNVPRIVDADLNRRAMGQSVGAGDKDVETAMLGVLEERGGGNNDRAGPGLCHDAHLSRSAGLIDTGLADELQPRRYSGAAGIESG